MVKQHGQGNILGKFQKKSLHFEEITKLPRFLKLGQMYKLSSFEIAMFS
jgi:hypothetical protein